MKAFIFLVLVIKYASCAKILAHFITASISHQVVFQKIWKELSLRGHQVTVITPNPLKDPSLVNLTEIDVSNSYRAINIDPEDFSSGIDVVEKLRITFYNMFPEMLQIQVANKEVEDIFLNRNNEKYDLVLVEMLYPVTYALAARYNCPYVGIISLPGLKHAERAVGNPLHPVAYHDVLLDHQLVDTVWDRLLVTYTDMRMYIVYHWEMMPKMDELARRIYGNDIPYLGKIENDVNLVLETHNFIVNKPKPTVPNLIELSNVHIKRNTTLPKDLKKKLDEATEGVIYFSLGSNVKSVNITNQLRDVICSTFSELPFTVLWKWESDYFPGKPKNVITRKWLNQEGVLAHPNVKIFITQGGLQSMEEAVFYKIPLLGMPFFGDQDSNIEKMVEMGLGLSVNRKTVTKEELKSKILKVINNPQFREKVLETSDIMFDQPMTGLEKAVWWIEYVIRHNGAKHLRNPLADMPLYQYLLLDIIGLVSTIFVISIVIIGVTLRYFSRFWYTNIESQKVKTS